VTAFILTLLALAILGYRARGERQRRVVDRGLRVGLTLAVIGFVVGFFGAWIVSGVLDIGGAPPSPTGAGFGLLAGVVFVGPAGAAIGFALGFLWGAAREWWRQSAI